MVEVVLIRRFRQTDVSRLVGVALDELVVPPGWSVVGIDGGLLPVSRIDLLLIGKCLESTATASVEKIVSFGGGKFGGVVEREVLERRCGGLLAVKDGVAIINLGSSEIVVGGAMSDNVFAGDVLTGVVQRGVEGAGGGDLPDVPRWHVDSVEFLLGGDLVVVRRYSRTVR